MNTKQEENKNIEYDDKGNIIIDTVELTIKKPKAGTLITGKDSSGFDQLPIPEVICDSENYFIGILNNEGKQRPEVYWKDYATLVFYSDIKMEIGKSYTVFGRVQAKPGYVFYDPVNVIVNGEELSIEEVEDYTLEGDSFCFYYDLKIDNEDN